MYDSSFTAQIETLDCITNYYDTSVLLTNYDELYGFGEPLSPS